jgi:hypothetical protein
VCHDSRVLLELRSESLYQLSATETGRW